MDTGGRVRHVAYYRPSATSRPSGTPRSATPQGGLRFEELMGEEGFSSDSSLLYHRGVPSAIVDSQAWELPDLGTTPNHPLKPRHLKLHDLFDRLDRRRSTRCTGRRLVLGNGDVRISYVVARPTSPYYRNAIGDECVYVEAGSGTVETSFGALSYRTGDYVLVPRATTHRWLPAEESRLYAIEANSPHRAAEALPVAVRPVPRARAVLRARPARPERAVRRRRAPTSRCWSSTAATAVAASSAPR